MKRGNHLEAIQQLDPEQDHIRICHLMAGYEFPWALTRSLEYALLKTFCIPSITRLLDHTQEFIHRPQKRYDDTGIIVSELVKHGYDSEIGGAALERMNRIHSHFSIDNRDYLYVLSSFIFEPIRWMERFAWRPMCEQEKLACYYFWRAIGDRMGIQNIPDSYAAYEAFNQEFEAEHFQYAESNQHIGESTRDMFLGWFPAPLRPLAKPGVHAFLDDSMRRALGFPSAPKALTWLTSQVLKTQSFVVRQLPSRTSPFFYVDASHHTYPEGYSLEKLGPPAMLDELNGDRPANQ